MEMAPKDPEILIGNTKSKSPKKRQSSAKRWCFTLNNWTQEEYDSIVAFCKNGSNVSSFIIGKEIGKEGTPHLQGYMELVVKKRLEENKELNKRISWRIAKGTRQQNGVYCSKDGDYIKSPNLQIPKPLKLIKEENFYQWQKDIIEIVKQEPDDRTIYWLWCDEGKSGKTSFSKYLSATYGAIPIDGKKNDILYCSAVFESEIYIFDFERTQEEFISYGGIEKIKNGYYMCAKYESKPIIRNNPHIFCFANFYPDISALSTDRWKIYELTKHNKNNKIVWNGL